MNRSSSATLEDVAEAAGVSLSTASRCINRPESVRAEKRQRILAAVERLDYVPHGAARALASKRTHMMGAVLPSLESTLFGGALDSFQNAASAAGYAVLVASSNYDPVLERTHVRNLIESGVEALLLVGALRDPEVYRLIEAKRIPYVVSWVHNDDGRHVYVGFDNAAAAEKVTNYLVSLGHRRFGMISGMTELNDRAQQRLVGVRGELARHGLSLEPASTLFRPFAIENGREGFRRLMALDTPPTAIICGSEPFAYGALFEAGEMGVKVPEAVSIASFDDMWLASQIRPSLTTVRTPRREMGDTAARYLVAKLEGENAPPPHILDTELIVRGSTGPAPPA